MSIENPYIAVHNRAVNLKHSAVESGAICQGYLENPKGYTVADDVGMSSPSEYKAYATSLEKTIDAFPVRAAQCAVESMALLHNIMQAGRYLRQLKPELASDITEQMAQEAYVFRKTGDYVGIVIQVHEFTAAHDTRYRPVCNVAHKVEYPFYAILRAEEQARACPREEYGGTNDPAAEGIVLSTIGESRINFVSVLNKANTNVINHVNAILNRAVATNHAVRLGYACERETSLSGCFVEQAAELSQKVAAIQDGLIHTLSATFEMARAADGYISPGPFNARTYTTAPMPSTFAKLMT